MTFRADLLARLKARKARTYVGLGMFGLNVGFAWGACDLHLYLVATYFLGNALYAVWGMPDE